MKKILLLAHDPGGIDVIFPTYLRLKAVGEEPILSCLGPAGELKKDFQTKEEEFYSKLRSLVNKKKVKALVTGTSWGSKVELEAIRFCKEKGVPTISILDYWVGYASRFRFEKTFIYPDYYIVMDELSMNEAVLEGVPEAILKPLGHPGLDSVMKSKEGFKEPAPLSTSYLFLSQPISRVYGDDLGYTEYTVLRDLENMDIPYFVKFHPKDDTIIRDLYRKRTVEGKLSSLIHQSSLVIGMSTMGMLHACILGKPTISYQPDLRHIDYAITNKLGLTPLYTEYEKVEAFFQAFKEDPAHFQVPKEKLQTFPWSDGQSTVRIVEFIREVSL